MPPGDLGEEKNIKNKTFVKMFYKAQDAVRKVNAMTPKVLLVMADITSCYRHFHIGLWESMSVPRSHVHSLKLQHRRTPLSLGMHRLRAFLLQKRPQQIMKLLKQTRSQRYPNKWVWSREQNSNAGFCLFPLGCH